MDCAAQTAREVPLSTLNPKFLHTNSTSHTGPFSAIAELIDNAYDPDVNAKQIWIDKTQIKDKDCLTFMDNGNGLNWYKMLRMLSFGYSDKKAVAGKLPIGMYGNGFKSGSMRLGQDVIIFSKSEKDLCVGMLSQSYLKETGAERITVPIISIKEPTARGVLEEHRASLKVILDHSPFNTEEELLTELQAIESTGSTTGTQIIIWNLRRTSAGNVEFDFTTDRYDIRIPCDVFDSEAKACQSSERSDSSVPESDFSLRAYCSILYMKPRMQINIRGQKVKTQLISKSLAHIAKDIYKPSFLKQKIPIIFGYNTKSKEQYGIMMYHKNRLIKAYLRVGCQLNATNRQGIGVIGVIECNFLKPTHNKQDFDYTDNYRNAIRNVAIKLEEYCKEMRFKRKKNNPSNDMLIEETEKRPDQNWAQCDGCQQWRRLPDGIDPETLPEEWFCSMNPDPQFRLCETKEEPEDSDSEQPTYPKTYKIHEREEKKKQDKMKELKKEASSMNTPQTPEQGASASTVAPGDLVITEVFSLSKSPSRMKRRQPLTPQSQSKRPTVSSVRRTLDTYLSSFTSPLTPVPRDDVNHDHDLREGSRAPVLKEPTICTASGSLASLEVRSTGNDATEMRDTSTETQGPRVKEEEEMDVSTAANDGATVKKEGSLDINQAQEQQDQLMELLHAVSSERDSFKEMINELQAQLMEEKQRPDSQAQYKLYEQAEKKAEELSRENETLLQAHANVLQQNQEQAKQIEVLTNRLDQGCHKLEELRLKINQLEEEKASISAEYEKIKSSQTQLKNKVANLFNGI